MKLPRRKFLHLAAGAAALPAVAVSAYAQSYPTRPLRLVLGYPAGGSTDLVARIMGAWLAERLGQSVVVENKPGAGTTLAAQAVVASPPDGYTLLFVATTYAINATFHKTLPYDFLRDIAPVAALVDLPFVMEVGPSVPARTVAEFIAHAKANPGKVNMASFGTGTTQHLAGELFKMMTGVEHGPRALSRRRPMVDRPDRRPGAGRGSTPCRLAAAYPGGHAARARRHRAGAIDALPDVPTVGETVPGYEVSGWTGIGVPAGTPAPIIATLNREINAGLADPRIKARLADVGGRPILLSPEQFGKVWLRDTDKWAKVLTSAAAKPQ